MNIEELQFRDKKTDEEKYAHGGNIYAQYIQYDFSANLNPLGMPKSVKQALIDGVDSYANYPDTECRALVREIVKRYQGTAGASELSPLHIVCGNGAADLIYRIVSAIKPKNALLIAPTFSEYEKALKEAGSSIHFHLLEEANGFALTDAILGDMTQKTDLLFLCHPNNPTGRTVESEVLRHILEKSRTCGTVVVVDECFLEFVDGGEAKSTAVYLNDYDNLIVLKAFTKIYAMAGLRLGYLLSKNALLADAVRRSGQCWSVSAPAQLAGVAALKENAYIQKTVRYVARERVFLEDALQRLGCRVYPSEANYILLYHPAPLAALLKEKNIAIRHCANYRGLSDGYFRIAVRTHEENVQLIDALQTIVEKESFWRAAAHKQSLGGG